MKRKIQLETSGIPLVDKGWGGFYRGGSYLLVGPHKSGKTLLGLQYAMEAARHNEVCVYFTSKRPKDLLINAASIDIDLQKYMNQNLVIVIRVTPPADASEEKSSDEILQEYFHDILSVVNQFEPDKVFFDELTPFLNFEDFNLFREAFLQTTEAIEDKGITSVYVLREPATPAAESLVDSLVVSLTGIIYINKDENNSSGEMVITPTVGHPEGKIKSKYHIEPYIGVKVDYQAAPVSPLFSSPKEEKEKLFEIKFKIDSENGNGKNKVQSTSGSKSENNNKNLLPPGLDSELE